MARRKAKYIVQKEVDGEWQDWREVDIDDVASARAEIRRVSEPGEYRIIAIHDVLTVEVESRPKVTLTSSMHTKTKT